MTEILLLRLVHILSATFWLGAGLLSSLFLMPTLAAAGPSGGAVLQGLRTRGLMTWMPIAAILTLVTGSRLWWVMAAGQPAVYLASPMGRTLAWSGAAALLGFALAMLVGRPSQVQAAQIGARLGEVGAMLSASERDSLTRRVAILRRRGGQASFAAVVLLTLSAAGMAVARYL
ncbi:MAG: hypothetical protein IBJ03_15615 [Gemmatimonadaceae bacterium]|nr:hypothetical protein [Gemmatimonadaceae bacterium]